MEQNPIQLLDTFNTLNDINNRIDLNNDRLYDIISRAITEVNFEISRYITSHDYVWSKDEKVNEYLRNYYSKMITECGEHYKIRQSNKLK